MVDTRRHLICECGDPKYRHHHTTMSVRLPHNPNPLYDIDPAYHAIARTFCPNSSLDTDLCPCGCTTYVPLLDSES